MQNKTKISILKKLEYFISTVFKTTLEIFLEALKLSPNAQGYVSGSITELLIKKHLEALNYSVKRIREKWEGQKHPNHYGDFYFQNKKSYWFVLEAKGLKSNSEKWHKLYNYDRLKALLFSEYKKIKWIKQNKEIEPQIDCWIKNNLPKLLTEYKDTLYDYEEIAKYKYPKKETQKSKSIKKLRKYSRKEINQMINNRLEYIMKKVKVLETHFVSSSGVLNDRTQATPRKDEFNIIAVDIFLKFPEHKFLFANPKNLDSSSSDVNHLQQNYIIGFIFNETEPHLSDEWCNDFDEILKTLTIKDSISEKDMQIDDRQVLYNEQE